MHSRLADSRSFTGTHREGMVDMYRTASGNPAGAHGLAPTLRKEPRTGPETPAASIDSAPIRTVGMLFMPEESTADRTPVPKAAPHMPPSAERFMAESIQKMAQV